MKRREFEQSKDEAVKKPWFYIEELEGKYYGTILKNTMGGSLEIWGLNRLNQPSHRELAKWDTPEEFEVYDSHYEDVGDYDLARVIRDALNNHFGHTEYK